MQQMEAEKLLLKAGEAAAFLRAIAHEHRLAILCCLESGALSVGDIAAQLDISQPKVSQHLMRLRAEHLVKNRRDGTTIYYELASKPARAIVGTLKEAFCPPDAAPRRTRKR